MPSRASVAGVLLVLASFAPAVAAAGYRVTARPAWDGHYRPGLATGLTLAVTGDGDGPATLTVDDGRLPQRYRLELAADRPFRLATVVRPPASAAVTWRVAGEDGTETGAVRFRPLPPGRPLVADLANEPLPPERAPPGALRVAVAPESLPSASPAWQPLAGLAVDRRALAAFAGGARHAFGDWLAGCGAVAAADRGLQRVLADAAGCRGTAIHGPGEPLQARPAERLDPARLDALFAPWPPAGLAVPLAAVLTAYAVALLLLRARPGWLLAAPIAATGVIAAFADGDRSVVEKVAWETLRSGEPHALRDELWQVHGGGRGVVRLPAETGIPWPLAQDAAVEVHFDGRGTRLALATALLDTQRLALERRVAAEAVATLHVADGVPTVRNRGTRPLRGARLYWDHGIRDLPELAPGARWRATAGERARRAPADAAERLLAARAEEAALLVQLAPRRWQMIRAGGTP